MGPNVVRASHWPMPHALPLMWTLYNIGLLCKQQCQAVFDEYRSSCMTHALRLSPLLESSRSKTPAEGQGLDGHLCPSWAANLEDHLYRF